MNAYLLLANGMVFAGRSVGAEGVTVGEVVFATGMVGFQETLTDPSYYGQIITQTYPLIGNYGMNKDDMESDKIWAKGYIVREACQTPSNWRCEETLDSFLKKNNTIGIEGIDTRHLTRIIRESGVMNGAILTTFDPADPANKAETDKLLEEIRAYAVTDAVKSVTCAEPEVYNEKGETHIVLMHYGCKRNIIRCLVRRGCKVTVMPAFATAEEVAALDPDGIMLSNGPGDPAEPVEVIENLKHIFELNIPTFGICLGHQLSALAAGAKTMKLKYGHRGANQPVTDFESGRTFITSQNHGYAVVGDELPAEMGEVAQVNANDGTCEGIKYKKWNCFTVQFHPEANGGPKDTEFLFDRFLNKPTSGKIIIDGRDLWAEPEKIRDFRFLTGLVFQYPEYQLFEETCYKDIAFGPKNMGLDEAEVDKRVHEAAEFVGLDEALLERSPFELSGGQKRRVAVAGVMAMKPRILVLDEPAAGLDPEGRDEILSEVKDYHKKTGTTVLLVSHSMEDIAKYADKVLVMSRKKIAMYDTVEKVFARAPELLELGLSVPQVTKIFLKLREMGVDVPADVYTIPYAVKMILAAKARRDAGETLVLPRNEEQKGGAAGC